MTIVLICLFVLNLILVLLDASVAFHKARRFVAFINPCHEARESGSKKIKSLLPFLVALYVSLDCYAYSLRHVGYLVGLTVLLIGDVAIQLLISRKGESCEG